MLPSHTRSHSDSSEKAAFFSATLRRGITRVFFPLAVTLVSDFPAVDNPCCQFSSSTSSASKSSKVKFNLQVTRKVINGYWQLFVSGSIGHTSWLKPWQNKKCQTFIGMLVLKIFFRSRQLIQIKKKRLKKQVSQKSLVLLVLRELFVSHIV